MKRTRQVQKRHELLPLTTLPPLISPSIATSERFFCVFV